MEFSNVYEDGRRVQAYCKLDFSGAYLLTYRDLPEIIGQHVSGNLGLDFGCGTGRSARFLKSIGFETIGVDISTQMIRKGLELDPQGKCLIIDDGDLGGLTDGSFDLVLSVYTFDNVPTMSRKLKCLKEMSRVRKPNGRIVNLVSSPSICTHEWTSFTTNAFPENLYAQSGDKVKVVIRDIEDQRPVEDVLWSDEAYREVYHQSGLEVAEIYRPLGKQGGPYAWVNETTISPWVIYVLKKA